MQATNRRECARSCVVLGWVYIVANALLLIAGALVFFLLFGLGYASCAWEPFIILGGLGVFLGVLIVLLAILGILAGCGLVRCCAWGRTLGIIVAVLGLICFPVGTVIGIFALFVLLQDDCDARPRPDGPCGPGDPCGPPVLRRPKDPCPPGDLRSKDPCYPPERRPKDPCPPKPACPSDPCAPQRAEAEDEAGS